LARVTNVNVAPYRCICRVVARAYDRPDNEYSVGTGFLISPNHVLTCAHNIYPLQSPHTGSIDVFPAQNGPDENARRFRANGWAVSPGWKPGDCRTAAEDYGVIRLASAVPNGFFPLRPFDPAGLTGKLVHLAGYPSTDRERRARFMYRSTGLLAGAYVVEGCARDRAGKENVRGRLFRSLSATTNLMLHQLATAPSMSGSPLWIEEEGSRVLIGIHERRIEDDQGRGNYGAAIVLNSTVRARVESWLNNALRPLRTN
jgi:V8-like Glu-specific endopeptidase